MAQAKRGTPGFGRWLQSWRHGRRMTQMQLAEALRYDLTYIAMIEGGRRPASGPFLVRLAEIAGETPDGMLRAAVQALGRPSLPYPDSVMIGRDAALADVLELVAGAARCVTLVGPPGIGKTRLATEVATRLDHTLADGSWWISLLDLRHADEVGGRLRRDLSVANGSGDDPDGDPDAAIIARMRDQEALLLLDNFEHLIDARALVSRIVTYAPGVTVLVTSREPLRIASEHEYHVPGLAFPDPATQPSFEEARASPAVELFVARAAMSRRRFKLTAGNCRDVVTACAQLDGVPLAIVLAAGAVRTAEPAELVELLKAGADLTEAAPADMPAHHRTLGAAIGWSWDPLRDEEKRLLAEAGAFAGGFTVDAMAAVDDRDRESARRLIAGVARKSLVEARPDAPSGPRFELLETIRSFALARLDASGRRDEVQRRHLAYFVAFAEDCGRRIIGPDQVPCTVAFTDEFDNLRIAFDWALEIDPSSAIRLAASMWRFFLMRDIPTGRRWLDAALERAPERTPARATALAAAGALGWVTGHAKTAARCLAESAALAEALGLPDVLALALVNEAALALQQNRNDDADNGYTRALSLYAGLDDRRGRAVALNGQGLVLRRRGRARDAWPLWAEAAALFRSVGDRMNAAIALGNMAWAAEVEGRLDQAKAMSLECRDIQVALGDGRGLAATAAALGRIAFRGGAAEESRALHLEALVGFQRLGDLPWAASCFTSLAALAVHEGSYELAVTLVGMAESLWQQIGAPPNDDDAALLETVTVQCRSAIDQDAYERAFSAGRALTLSEGVAVAHGHRHPLTG